MTRSTKAAVFDLDGTLIESLGDISDALNRLLTDMGRHTLDEAAVRTMVGDGAAKLVERACTATGGVPASLEPLVSAFIEFYESVVAVRTRPYPGVPETLERLTGMGIRLGVCSNKPARATRDVLAALDLDRFFSGVRRRRQLRGPQARRGASPGRPAGDRGRTFGVGYWSGII